MAQRRDIPHDERDNVFVPAQQDSHTLAAEEGTLEIASSPMSRKRFFEF
jgi:hypothetical protein